MQVNPLTFYLQLNPFLLLIHGRSKEKYLSHLKGENLGNTVQYQIGAHVFSCRVNSALHLLLRAAKVYGGFSVCAKPFCH